MVEKQRESQRKALRCILSLVQRDEAVEMLTQWLEAEQIQIAYFQDRVVLHLQA